jgi:hypothetical protein
MPYNYKINQFYYNIDIIDDNTHTDQWNSYLIRNIYYPKQDLHASHFQVDTVQPDFARKSEEGKLTVCAKLLRE